MSKTRPGGQNAELTTNQAEKREGSDWRFGRPVFRWLFFDYPLGSPILAAKGLALILAAGLLLSGCVTYRGAIRGVAVDKTTQKAVPFMEAYHYVRRHTRWPVKRSTVIAMEAQKTTRYGNFEFRPVWSWHIPFMQSIEDERVILNLTLDPQLLIRAFEDGIVMNYWVDPKYVDTPDPQYMGLVFDIKGHFLWRSKPPDDSLPVFSQSDPFHRVVTNRRDLGHITVVHRGQPAGSAAQAEARPPRPTEAELQPAPIAPVPPSNNSQALPLDFE